MRLLLSLFLFSFSTVQMAQPLLPLKDYVLKQDSPLSIGDLWNRGKKSQRCKIKPEQEIPTSLLEDSLIDKHELKTLFSEACIDAIDFPEGGITVLNGKKILTHELESLGIHKLMKDFSNDKLSLSADVISWNESRRLIYRASRVELLDFYPAHLAKRMRLDIHLFQPNQKKPSRLSIWYKITGKALGFVAKKNVKAKSMLNIKHFKNQEVDLFNDNGQLALTHFPLEARVKSSIRKKTVLTERVVEAIPHIQKKQKMTLLMPDNGLQIEAEVKAMQEGMIGDVIEVYILASKTRVNARVIDKNRVYYEYNE